MRSRQGRQELAISRTGITSDRDVLAAGESEQRWRDRDVPSFKQGPVRFGIRRLLVVCFVFASWPSASTILGEGIARDIPTQSWRPPSLNRAESGSIYVRGSISSYGIAAEAFQWWVSTTKVGSQPERLLMAKSTTKDVSLWERIARRGARVIWKQNIRRTDTTQWSCPLRPRKVIYLKQNKIFCFEAQGLNRTLGGTGERAVMLS